MDAHYMEGFLTHNFSHQCIKDRYCFRCDLSFCSHCCPSHWLHHPPHARDRYITRVQSIGGHMMIDVEDSKGIGYDWRRIQKLKFHGRHWMHLQRPHHPLPTLDYPHFCSSCGGKRTSRSSYCAIICQREHVPGGNIVQLAADLLAANWGQLDCDTYCTRCSTSFSSVYCDQHLELHHPNQAAATIPIFHHQGWFLVPAEQNVLPAAVFDGLQVINVNGVAMHPIRSRPLQQQVPPIANGMHPCAGPCWEARQIRRGLEKEAKHGGKNRGLKEEVYCRL